MVVFLKFLTLFCKFYGMQIAKQFKQEHDIKWPQKAHHL
jgi:hypothetical protein